MMKNIEEVKNTLSSLSWIAFEEDKNKLIQLFDESNNEGKKYILDKMKSDKSDETKNFVIKVMYNKELDDTIRAKAIIVLSFYKDKKHVREHFLSFLYDESTEIVVHAIMALSKYKKYAYVKEKLLQLRRNTNNNHIINAIDYHLRTYGNIKINKHEFVEKEYRNKKISGDPVRVLKKINNDTFHLSYVSLPMHTELKSSLSNYNEYLEMIKRLFVEIKRVLLRGRVLAIHIPTMIDMAIDGRYKNVYYPIQYDLYVMLKEIGFYLENEIIIEKSSLKKSGEDTLPLMYNPDNNSERLFIVRSETDKPLSSFLRAYSHSKIQSSKIVNFNKTSTVWKIKSNETILENVVKLYSLKGDLVLLPTRNIMSEYDVVVGLKRYAFAINDV